MPTYLLFGPNTFASTQKRREIIERYVAKSGALNCGVFEGQELTIDRYKDAVLTMPLLATTRLAIFVNCLTEAKPEIREFIEHHLNDIPAETVALFHETKTVDRRTGLFRKLVKPKQSQEFAVLTPPQIITWLIEKAAEYGGSIDQSVAHQLVERVGQDLWLLDQELKKLVSFQPNVTRAAIKQLSPDLGQESVFAILDALRDQQPDHFITISDALLKQGHPVPYLISMINAGLRQMALVLSEPNSSPYTLAKTLRLPPFVIQKIRQSNWSKQQVVDSYRQLIELDLAIKTGTIKEEVALDMFAIRTMGKNRQ